LCPLADTYPQRESTEKVPRAEERGRAGTAGQGGREHGGKFHASSFAKAAMRNYWASARWAGEIERWVREWLMFAAASLLTFAGASRPRPRMGAPTTARARCRAKARFTSTRRSGSGGGPQMGPPARRRYR